MMGRKSRRIAALQIELAWAESTIDRMAGEALAEGERVAAEQVYLASLLDRLTEQLSIRMHLPVNDPAVTR